MAQDRSDDDALEEVVSSSAKILGLPKKTAIIAAAVFLVVVIAASLYFFLATGKDEQVETALQTSDSLEAITPSDAQQAAALIKTDEINTLQTEVFDLREKVIQLKEENLVLKKKIYDFETNVPASTQQQSNQASSSSNSQFKPGEPIEFKDFPPIEPAVPVEKPKPKWG